MSPNLLDNFPVELLLRVRVHTPENDLRSLVCFSMADDRTSLRLAQSPSEEDFWLRSCRLVGLSCVPDDIDADGRISWVEIALDCIEKDGFCEQPECGNHLLQANGMWHNVPDYVMSLIHLATAARM